MATSDDLEVLAGEYVLGVLTQEERAAVERRLAREPELARLVAAWERRLAPLALAQAPVAPPPHVWWNIVRSLGQAAEDSRAPWWRRVGFWRLWALGTSLATLALAALLVLRPPVAEPRLVAVLLDSQAQPAWLVSASPEADRLRARPLLPPPGDRRAQQLWLLPPGQNPVSLGLLDSSGTVTRPLAAATSHLLAPGQGVAVSLEPPGGSPTGLPTGPVVYKGVLIGDG